MRADPPKGIELPKNGFAVEDAGYIAPAKGGVKILVDQKKSERLQLLKPFTPIGNGELQNIHSDQGQGKCTTDHISMAGPLAQVSRPPGEYFQQPFIGATNAFNDERNKVLNLENGQYMEVPTLARVYQKKASAPSFSAKKTSAKAPAANTLRWNRVPRRESRGGEIPLPASTRLT